MGRLVLRRLLATIPVLVLVTAGVFALIHLTPGDPIDVMMAESVDATVKANLRRELGLDQPIYAQYAAWTWRLLHGDLGRSIRNGEPVNLSGLAISHRAQTFPSRTVIAMIRGSISRYPSLAGRPAV